MKVASLVVRVRKIDPAGFLIYGRGDFIGREPLRRALCIYDGGNDRRRHVDQRVDEACVLGFAAEDFAWRRLLLSDQVSLI